MEGRPFAGHCLCSLKTFSVRTYSQWASLSQCYNLVGRARSLLSSSLCGKKTVSASCVAEKNLPRPVKKKLPGFPGESVSCVQKPQASKWRQERDRS